VKYFCKGMRTKNATLTRAKNAGRKRTRMLRRIVVSLDRRVRKKKLLLEKEREREREGEGGERRK